MNRLQALKVPMQLQVRERAQQLQGAGERRQVVGAGAGLQLPVREFQES